MKDRFVLAATSAAGFFVGLMAYNITAVSKPDEPKVSPTKFHCPRGWEVCGVTQYEFVCSPNCPAPFPQGHPKQGVPRVYMNSPVALVAREAAAAAMLHKKESYKQIEDSRLQIEGVEDEQEICTEGDE